MWRCYRRRMESGHDGNTARQRSLSWSPEQKLYPNLNSFRTPAHVKSYKTNSTNTMCLSSPSYRGTIPSKLHQVSTIQQNVWSHSSPFYSSQLFSLLSSHLNQPNPSIQPGSSTILSITIYNGISWVNGLAPRPRTYVFEPFFVQVHFPPFNLTSLLFSCYPWFDTVQIVLGLN